MANPENLVPHQVKPGEVKNPTGVNQYTYRRDAEKHLDEWCKKHGQELIDRICDEAKAKKPWAAKLMLDRILPAVTKHEVDLGESAPLDAFLSRMGEIRRSGRGNGKDREADASRAEDGNGGAV